MKGVGRSIRTVPVHAVGISDRLTQLEWTADLLARYEIGAVHQVLIWEAQHSQRRDCMHSIRQSIMSEQAEQIENKR